MSYLRNPKKLLENTFSFLENDFAKQVYTRNQEIDLVFSNNVAKVAIMYDLGMDWKYHIDISIEKCGVQKNLLDCYGLFGEVKLKEFKLQIEGKKVENQIAIYGEFLSENIQKLTS